MLHEDLDRLAKAPLDRSLDGLEADIWRGIDAHTIEQRAYRGVMTLQLAILAVGIFGSVMVGHQWAATHNPAGPRGVFSPYTRLAASSLLMGESR